MMNLTTDLILHRHHIDENGDVVECLWDRMQETGFLNSYFDGCVSNKHVNFPYDKGWWIAINQDPRRHLYTVDIKRDPLGFVILTDIKMHIARVHFGTCYRGNGFEKIALGKWVVDQLMQKYSWIKTFWGLVSARNEIAIKFLWLLGARPTGVIQNGSFHMDENKFYDSILMTLQRDG